RAALASEGCYPGPPLYRHREANIRFAIPAVRVLADRHSPQAGRHTAPFGQNGRRLKSLSPRCCAPAKAPPISPVHRYISEAVKALGYGPDLARVKRRF